MSEVEKITIWYDKAGNFLEVIWEPKAWNYYTSTATEAVDALVDGEGKVCGFMLWGINRVNAVQPGFVNFALTPVALPQAQPEPAAAV